MGKIKNLRSDKFHILTSSQSGFGQVTTSLTPVLFLNGTKGSPYFIGLQWAVCKSLCNMLTVTSSLRNMVSRSQGWGRSESGSGWMPKQQQQNTLTDFTRQEIFYLSSLMWDVLQNCWRWHQWCHHLCLLFVILRLSGWLHARLHISADSSTGFVRHTHF